MDDLQAFLDSGAYFQGKISFSGTVRVDGHLQGEVQGDGTLIVGDAGVVEATIRVGRLILHGRVVGSVTAKDSVEIGPRAQLEGELTTPRLRVAEGSRLCAKVAMGEPVVATKADPPR